MEQDELLWAAVWLYIATGEQEYKAYIAGASNVGGVRQSLAWDDKFVGAQALVAKVMSHDPSRSDEASVPDDCCRPCRSSSYKGSCPKTAATPR